MLRAAASRYRATDTPWNALSNPHPLPQSGTANSRASRRSHTPGLRHKLTHHEAVRMFLPDVNRSLTRHSAPFLITPTKRYAVRMSIPSAEFPSVIVFDHPLIQHKLTHLRDHTTGHRPFRALLYQIAGLMVYEATRSLPVRTMDVQTPVEMTRGARLSAVVTVVPVLRSGLGMAEGILEMMPEARVGHLGLARDEATLQPRVYLRKLPFDLAAGPVLLVDPMLATGGSASEAVRLLREAGAKDLRMICLVAAPEGIRRMLQDHPELVIYTAAIDRQLDERGYICPGLGDAGDRMYGTE